MKREEILRGGTQMIVLRLKIDNIYSFKNFSMDLTYPKRIVGSSIEEEHLADRPNFRYKKVNVIMGANASGKTTLGQILMKIFNFLEMKNHEFVTNVICDTSISASFTIDLASPDCILYRANCVISPRNGEKYTIDDVRVEIRQEKIRKNDSYESCIRRLESKSYLFEKNYIEELEKICNLDWLFEYPQDTTRRIRLPKNDNKFILVLDAILKSLDPSIISVEESKDVENAYVIRLPSKAVVLQDGELFTTMFLSSGTKAGVEVADVVSALIQKRYSFYYCDEKFPYIHTDIEKAILSLMISSVPTNGQLFFTTHNTDLLDMDLPKHSFIFLKKDVNNQECPISCVYASSLLKRNTDSLKTAVENDLFSTAPALDLIYSIADL